MIIFNTQSFTRLYKDCCLLASCFLLGILSFHNCLAQEATPAHGIIQGYVQDSLSDLSLEYVTVAVQHARFPKVLNGTITDEKGRFKITGMAPGQYRLSLSFVGYQDKIITEVIIKEEDILTDVGRLVLSQGIGLEEIEVVGKRSLIEQQFDKIVYNTEDDISTGQTLNDMLRKVPMVSVDAQGNVSLRGSGNVQILIDNKPATMFAGNVTDALRAIPPDQVKKIEVITMPSARYDAEGSAGVINIITKQAESRGYNYSLNLAGGNQSLINNINFRAKGKKLGFNISIGNTRTFMPPLSVSSSRVIETEEINSLLLQAGDSKYRLNSWNMQAGLSYQINDFHELSTSFRYNPRRTTSQRHNLINLFSNATAELAIERSNTRITDSGIRQWALDYRRKFRNPDLNWNSTFLIAAQEKTSDYTLLEMSNKMITLDELSLNNGNNFEVIASTDYLQKVNDRFKFELGAKFISRNINTVSTHQIYDFTLQNYQPSSERSFDFPYHQNVWAAYAEGNFQLRPNWTLRTGLRLEQTNNTISDQFQDYYTNLAPSLALNYIAGTSTFTLSYSRRLSRPGLSYLNPFENRSDPLNWKRGNPQLKPELVDAFDFNFSQPIKQTFLNGSVYYHRTIDVIEQQTLLLNTATTLTSYNNIGNNFRLGLNFFFSSTINDNLNLKGGGNITYYSLSNTFLPEGSYNKGTQLTSYALLSWQIRKGWASEILGAYITPEWTAQQKNNAFYTYQLSLKKNISSSGSLSLTTVNLFHPEMRILKETTAGSIYSRNELLVPLRMINLGFQYSFSKNLSIDPTTSKNTFENTDLKKEENNKPF